MEIRTQIITFAMIAAIVLATGCGSTKEAKRPDLPKIASEHVQFIRVTDLAYRDLWVAAVDSRSTPTKEAVENEIKRQRVFGTEMLDKGDLFIPCLTCCVFGDESLW